MSDLFTSLLGQLDLLGIENEKKYSLWEKRIKEYTDERDIQLKEFEIDLPQDFESLEKAHFNAIEYILEELEGPGTYPITKEHTAIVEKPLKDLVALISLGQLLSVLVLEAYVRYAAIAQQFTNCISQVFLDEARKRAQYLDDYLKEHGEPVGPLHGVPISVKEHIPFKGKVTHCSYVSMLNNIPKENQASIQMMYDMGAVFYVRTNQPQSLMAIDSHNNVTGPTLNPYNLTLSAGGSTAGEGALLACKGSLVGIGSDIGGSLRVPASFTGTVGYKPTVRRFSCRDENVYGDDAIAGVYGPMCRRVCDIDYFMETYINEGRPWLFDETVVPFPWKKIEPLNPEKITIAVVYDNGIVKPTPPIKRGLDYVVSKLKNAGFKVVPFEPPKALEAANCVNKLYHAKGTEFYLDSLKNSGEPILKLTKWQLAFGKGAKGLDFTELEENTKLKNEIARLYFDYARKHNVAAILGPIGESVAPLSNNGLNWSYTNIYNLIDWPAVAFPTGLYQDPNIDVWGPEHETYKPVSQLEQYCHEAYNPEKSVGAPIGLQLASPPFQDELVIAIAAAISKILELE